MKKNLSILSVVLCIVTLIAIMTPLSVLAENDSIEISVFDNANLLTADEEGKLQEIANKYNAHNMSCVFLTANDTNGKSSMTYSDDFYDNNGFKDNGILFFIDMDNRTIYVNTVGTVISLIDDYEVEKILDEGYYYVQNGNYYKAFVSMEDYSSTLIFPEEVALVDKLMPDGTSVALSVFITLVVVVILFVRHYSACKKPNAKVYTASPVRILNKNAIFAGEREEVIRDYYKQPSNSGRSSGGRSRSGGSSHRSSSGRSHGGGGRRF